MVRWGVPNQNTYSCIYLPTRLPIVVIVYSLANFLQGVRRGAPKPLGLQNGKIPNRAITASSSYNRYLAPWLARLKRAKQGRYLGGWAAKVNNRQQWLQVRFKRAKKVVAVAIQGRQDFNQWVKLFSLSYSVDGVYFAKYKKNGRTKVCKSYV